MRLDNAIRKLEKHADADSVRFVKSRYGDGGMLYARFGTYGFSAHVSPHWHTGVLEVSLVKLRRDGDNDDPYSDYSGGSFFDTVGAAVGAAVRWRELDLASSVTEAKR